MVIVILFNKSRQQKKWFTLPEKEANSDKIFLNCTSKNCLCLNAVVTINHESYKSSLTQASMHRKRFIFRLNIALYTQSEIFFALHFIFQFYKVLYVGEHCCCTIYCSLFHCWYWSLIFWNKHKGFWHLIYPFQINMSALCKKYVLVRR